MVSCGLLCRGPSQPLPLRTSTALMTDGSHGLPTAFIAEDSIVFISVNSISSFVEDTNSFYHWNNQYSSSLPNPKEGDIATPLFSQRRRCCCDIQGPGSLPPQPWTWLRPPWLLCEHPCLVHPPEPLLQWECSWIDLQGFLCVKLSSLWHSVLPTLALSSQLRDSTWLCLGSPFLPHGLEGFAKK